MQSFDVVIVGAGPAGLKCAESLGNSSLSVLLLEKNSIIGPKVCAGGLTKKDLKNFIVPQELIQRSFKEIRFNVGAYSTTSSSSKPLVFTIDRKILDNGSLINLSSLIT